MSSETRKYSLKARAEKQAETRRRIVEATAALHEEVGPARTTVVEIARRAGVQRLTVYNNFPDEELLFAACGEHWMAQNPLPDPSAALALKDPVHRVHRVLGPLYSWYRKTAQANEHLHRDRLVLPALDAVMKVRVDERSANLAAALAAGFRAPARNSRAIRAAIALALDFWTWRRLAGEGMSDGEAATLMAAAVKSATR